MMCIGYVTCCSINTNLQLMNATIVVLGEFRLTIQCVIEQIFGVIE